MNVAHAFRTAALVVPSPKCYTHRMAKFTFIHAADLHLGAPFKGLDAAASGALASGSGRGNILAEAGFTALKRLEAACYSTGAAFLVLAGDIYDDKDGVLRARFALRDMFLRLKDAGVRVFIAHGNHDPLRSGPLPVAWPDNVTVFGKDVSCECVIKDGVPLALVQGVSHAVARETENLALRFRRFVPGMAGTSAMADVSGMTGTPMPDTATAQDSPNTTDVTDTPDSLFAALPDTIPHDIFQIAVLHCAVGGAGEGHAPYAPCVLSDLTGAGFDYWALGHVHQGRVLSENPFVVYPGSFLGLHVNETGPRGCCVVRVEDGGCSVERLPLAPVVWEKLRLPLDLQPNGRDGTDGASLPATPGIGGTPNTVDALEEQILAILDDAKKNADAILFCRVILEGATELDAVLRRPGSVATLLDRVRRELASGAEEARVWVKDILVATLPARDFAALTGRDDLVGEVVRMAEGLQADEARGADFVEKAVASLYGHAKIKKALSGGVADAESVPASGLSTASAHGVPSGLVDEAKALLCSLLEGGEPC